MGLSGLLVGWKVPTSGSLPEPVESSTKILFLLTSIFLYVLISLLLHRIFQRSGNGIATICCDFNFFKISF